LQQKCKKARKAWSQVFQAPTEINFNTRILYAAKLLFQIELRIITFHEKQKQK
jgi:hypothetical protein